MGPGKACTQQSSRAQQLNRPPMHGVNQLETNNIRPLGFRGNTRVQDRFLEATIPGMSASPTASQKDAQLMNTEVLKLLEKRAIVVVDPPHTQGFLSRVFLVPKKDGSQRPVINLRQLNQLVIWEHFKMENIHLVEHLIQEGDWMVKNRSQGRIFCSPNSQGPSTMATSSLARPGLPVLLPSIRPVLSPPGVHKDHTPNSGVAEATGSEIDCLHR